MSQVKSIVITRESCKSYGRFILRVDDHVIAEITYRDDDHSLQYVRADDAFNILMQMAMGMQDGTPGTPDIEVFD